ncbi:hypothetical protein KCU62_g50, partial [Aureobasidium sp. EXF-3399]
MTENDSKICSGDGGDFGVFGAIGVRQEFKQFAALGFVFGVDVVDGRMLTRSWGTVFGEADLIDGFGRVLFAWVAELPAHDYVEGIFHPGAGWYAEGFCQGFAVENGLRTRRGELGLDELPFPSLHVLDACGRLSHVVSSLDAFTCDSRGNGRWWLLAFDGWRRWSVPVWDNCRQQPDEISFFSVTHENVAGLARHDVLNKVDDSAPIGRRRWWSIEALLISASFIHLRASDSMNSQRIVLEGLIRLERGADDLVGHVVVAFASKVFNLTSSDVEKHGVDSGIASKSVLFRRAKLHLRISTVVANEWLFCEVIRKWYLTLRSMSRRVVNVFGNID